VIHVTLNKNIIGKKYTADPFEVTAHESIYYALACGEENDAYFDSRREGGIIVPPMYAVRYSAGPVNQIINDKETGLNFETVLHYSQEFQWMKTVRPGDKIFSEARVTHVQTLNRGGILGWEIISRNQSGEDVLVSRWELFDRSAGEKDGDRLTSDGHKTGDILWELSIPVKNGQTYIYAEPSGDHNAIHVDDAFAKSVGLKGIILQGLCTMAFAFRAVSENICGPEKDVSRIKRFYVQFARPVLPGQTITFQGYRMDEEEGGMRYGIIAKNEAGKEVLKGAWCLIV